MDVLENIFALFSKYDVKEKGNDGNGGDGGGQEEKFAEARLEDGTTIMTPAEEMAEGVEVYVSNDDGEQMPVPDGTYTLESGEEVVVSEGKIQSIEAAGGGDDEDEVEAKKKKDEEEKMAAEKKLQEQIDAAVSKALAEQKQEFEKQLKEKDDKLAEIEAKFEKQQGVPRGGEDEPKHEKVDLSKMNPNERINAIHKLYSNG